MGQTSHSAQTRQSATRPDQMPNPDGQADNRLRITCQAGGLMNLRTKDDIGDIMRRYFGTTLPERPNSFTRSGERRAVWLGPDESLLICSDHEAGELHRILSTQMDGWHFALSVISDALSVYSLTGPCVREVLAKGCALDLHKTVFTQSMCAQTALDRAAVTLICEGEGEIRLICRRSFADYVETWLKDAATEFGYEVR